MENNLRASRKQKSSPLRRDRQFSPRSFFKNLRLSKDLTQSKMANDLNLTEYTIRKIENGSGDPSFMMSFVYALYLGSNVEELFPDVVSEARMYYQKLQENLTAT